MERWAELRGEHFVRGVSIRELARRMALSRNTVRTALRSPGPPRYERASVGSKLDPFKDEIHRLLGEDATLSGQRIRELIAPLGFAGGKTIVDDYLRDVRPLFATPRTYQRTVYRPGGICQFDLWQPRAEVPVGHGQTRRGWVVMACLSYPRAGAGALVFSTQTVDLLCGIRRCLWSWARFRRRWCGIARPGCNRLREERAVMAPLPTTPPDTGRQWVLRVPPDPYLRSDTCDYSLDPRLVGRRVEARVGSPRMGRTRAAATDRRRVCERLAT